MTRTSKFIAGRRLLMTGLGGWLWLVGGWSCMLVRAQEPPIQQPQIIEIQPVSPTGRWLSHRLNGWRLEGPVTAMSAVAFESHQPERARLIREYGLRDMAFGTYAHKGMKIRVEIFRTINFVAAYGAYSLERSAQAERVAVGTEGALEADRLGFFKGEYYLRLVREAGPVDRAALLDLGRLLDNQLSPRHSEIPVLMQHLPSDGLVTGTERFVAGPLALARFGDFQDPTDVFLLSSEAVEAAVAEYRSGDTVSPLVIVEYHTPQLAAAAYQQVRRYMQSLPEAERARRLLKREGNYLIEVLNVQDPSAMQRIVDQIDYAPSIHWLKKDSFENLSLFQPAPEISLLDFYLTAFGFIGVSLLIAFTGGVLLGMGFFLWRRRRMRSWPGFSDAGGMMRLNLDNLVLPPPDRKALKRLPGK